MKITSLHRLLLPLILSFSSLSWSAQRLNMVVIVADDWGGPYASAYTGVYGHVSPSHLVKTPNIDKIAVNGVLFKNAFVNAPSCTASRSSIFSGRYFFNTKGGAFLGGEWDATIPSFPLLLHDAGYHIGLSGKGWSPGTPNNAPFGGNLYRYGRSGGQYNKFSLHVSNFMATGLTFAQAKQKVLNQVKLNFSTFLAARKTDQPFFYWFGPYNTHRSWVKGSGKALWGINPDDLTGKMQRFLPDVPEVREDMADYLGEVQALDAYVGVLLRQLVAIGELENTLIVVTGDNGPGGFPHGKFNLYDFGVATPLIIWLPNNTAGRVVSDFTTLMDLAPTFLEIAGVPIPAGMNGRSLLPTLTSSKSGLVDSKRMFAITGEERHIFAARENSLPYPARALRTAKYLYIRNFAPERWPVGCPFVTLPSGVSRPFFDMDPSPSKDWIIINHSLLGHDDYFSLAFAKRPAEELYDVVKDPDQVNNIADAPEYAMAKTQLANILLYQLKKAGDPRVIGDGGTFDQPPYTDLAPVTCTDTIPTN